MACAGLACATAGATAPHVKVGLTRYALTDLGSLGGGESYAYALNEQGHVVGVARTSRGALHPFLFASRRMVDLARGRVSVRGFAWRINRDGVTVGQVELSDAVSHACVYTSLGPQVIVDEGGHSSARCVNNRGVIVGSYVSNGVRQAFVYADGQSHGVPGLAGKACEANAINEEGAIAGWFEVAANPSRNHAFCYRGRVLDLGTLGGTDSEAKAVNKTGDVAGWADVRNQAAHAFLYRRGRMRDLGTLGGELSFALGLNDLGDVVGRSDVRQDTSQHAFLWRAGRMYDLNDLVPRPPGWRLVAASGVNGRGQICGWMVRQGRHHAYLLTPVR